MTGLSKLDVKMLVCLVMRLIIVMIWHCFFGIWGSRGRCGL